MPNSGMVTAADPRSEAKAEDSPLRAIKTRHRPGLLAIGLFSAAVAAAADLHRNEQVVFFPTLGWRVPGGWEAELHGCVFEMETRAVLTPFLRAALGIEEEELSHEEKALFRERARLFMMDHERGRSVTVKWVGWNAERPPVRLGPSEANGHVIGRVQFKAEELAGRGATNGLLQFETLGGPDEGPRTTGEIHLLSETGWSVISDIDDTIKISEVRDKKALLANTFLKDFRPVPGLSEVYNAWSQQGASFHYVSASPWQLYEPLAELTGPGRFPEGVFHLKTVRLTDSTLLDLFASPEGYKAGEIEPLLKAFPRRRFVLVGDTGEKDPEIYGAIARKYPEQIRWILIRDVTQEDQRSPRLQKAFADVPPERWRVFREAAELKEIAVGAATTGL